MCRRVNEQFLFLYPHLELIKLDKLDILVLFAKELSPLNCTFYFWFFDFFAFYLFWTKPKIEKVAENVVMRERNKKDNQNRPGTHSYNYGHK